MNTNKNKLIFVTRNTTALSSDDVLSVCDYALNGCNKLQECHLPNVTYVGNYGFSSCSKPLSDEQLSNLEFVGTNAFSGVTHGDLTYLNLKNLTNSSLKSNAFGTMNSLKVLAADNAKEIENNFIQSCDNLESAYLPNVERVREYAFRNKLCLDINDVYMPNAFDFEQYAFENTKTTSVDFKKYAGFSASEGIFNDCKNLSVVKNEECLFIISTPVQEKSYTSIPKNLFRNCVKLSSFDFNKTFPTTIEEIDTTCMFGNVGPSAFYNTALSSVKSDNLTSIEDYAFANCSSLSNIELNALTTCKKYAFANDINLSTISLPNAEFLQDHIFDNCTSITNLSIEKCTSIKGDTFANCGADNLSIYAPMVSAVLTSGFRNCNAEYIKLSNDVAILSGNNAFQNCKNLKKICIMPVVLNEIPQNTFSGCQALTAVELSLSSTDYTDIIIRENAFANTAISRLPNEEDIVQIGNTALSGNSHLTCINIPNCLHIGNYAFLSCNNVICANFDSLTSIQNETVNSIASSLQDISISSIESINDQLFINCFNLSNVIANNVVRIGKNAFSNTSLTSYTLPKTVEMLDPTAFANCKKLVDLSVDPENETYFSNINDVHYPAIFKIEDGITKLVCAVSTLSSLPEAITSLTDVDVNVLKGLKTFLVRKNLVQNIELLSSAQSLETLSVVPENARYTDMNGCNVIVENDTSALVVGCANSYLCGDIAVLCSYAFNQRDILTELVATDDTLSNLQLVQPFAFNNCKNLSNLEIGSSVENAKPIAYEENAIFNSSSNENAESEFVDLTATLHNVQDLKLGALKCDNLVQLKLPELSAVKDYQFEKSSLQHVQLDKVQSIGNYSFANCSKLYNCEVGPDLTAIGKYAFAHTGLTSVLDKMQFGAVGLYEGNKGIQALDMTNMPNAVLCAHEFDGSDLTAVAYLGTSLKDYVFANCRNLVSVYMPNLTSVNTGAFSSCTSLETIDLPAVTTVQTSAFLGCYNLTSFNMPNATTLAKDAFAYCGFRRLDDTFYPPKMTKFGNAFTYNALTAIELSNIIDIYQTDLSTNTATIEQIRFDKAAYINTNAFINCTFLTALDEQSFPKIYQVGNSAFRNCTKLTKATINPSFIQDYAFANTALTGIQFQHLDIVGAHAFDSCTSLISADLPNCYIFNEYAFFNCQNLLSVIACNDTQYKQYIYNSAFRGCSKLKQIEAVGRKVSVVGTSAFYGCNELEIDKTKLDFNQLTSIGNYAFTTSKLKEVTGNDFNQLKLLNNAFDGCKIEKYDLPNVLSVTGCSGRSNGLNYQTLQSINLPNAIELNDQCFYYCQYLSSANIPKTKNIGIALKKLSCS